MTASVCLAANPQGEDSPAELAVAAVRKAKRAAKEGEYAQAYMLYSQAAALQPRNRRYRAAMESLQSRAVARSKPNPTATPDEPKPLPDPFDSITEREAALARQLLPPPQLAAKEGMESFDLNVPLRELYTQVARRFGLETVFDADVPASGQPVRFRMANVDYREALEGLGLTTNTFATPLSSRVFMVAQDTVSKRNDLEQYIAISIPVPQVLNAQELTEIVQVVRQATNVEKVASNTARNEIIIRDRVSRALPAEALLRQLFSYRTDVLIELQFISVSSTQIRNYGFNITNQVRAVPLGRILGNAATPAGVANLVTFGGGRTLIGIGVAQVEALFSQSQAEGQVLYEAQLRSAAGQASTLHVGDKYPVLTSGFFGAPPGATGTTFQPPPSFTYENLGLDMKVTPHVHGMGEVTLALETSFVVLSGKAVNGIPIFGNRKVISEARLRNGEWAVVAGLLSETDSSSEVGTAGLSRIPLLGRLFRRTTTNRDRPTVLIGIRPRLLSLPASEKVAQPLRVGSETRPYIPL